MSPRPVLVMCQWKIKMIREVAWVVMVSFIGADSVVESAGGKLLLFIPDVYIHTDHMIGRMITRF